MRLKTTAILLLFFISLNAQIKFEKGYFISNTNERVECFIKNLDWRDNPSSIKYKLKIDDTLITEGDCKNIVEFGIYNESKYKRYDVTIEKSSTVLSSLTDNKNPVWQKATLFLKVLIEGEASLYVYTEGNSQKYFYETKNSPIEQLVRIEYIVSESNSYDGNNFEHSVKTNNQFRQQLYNNVRCDSMSNSDFEYLTYDKTSLLHHFTKYNNCSGKGVSSYVAKNETSALLIKLMVNGSAASLTIDAPVAYSNRHDKINKMIFGYGLEIEYLLPFDKNKWSLLTSPSYTLFDYNNTRIVNNGFGDEHLTTTVQYSYFELPLGLRYYMHLNDNTKLFVNGSFVTVFDSKKLLNSDNHGPLAIKSSTNFAVGCGINFHKKLSIELNSNFSRALLNNTFWSTNYTTLGLKVAYQLVQF